jgi:hypothetical protein
MVTFHSRASGDFSMFEEVAISLLHKMGHSGTVPSALMPEDIPLALQRLKGTLAQETDEAAPEGEEPPVSLSKRAWPLIKMLEAALADDCEVMWD